MLTNNVSQKVTKEPFVKAFKATAELLILSKVILVKFGKKGLSLC